MGNKHLVIAEDRIPIARPPFDVAESLAAVAPCFESGWITMGPAVAEFEAAIAEIIGVGTVACSSCTAGIHLALLAWQIGPGDEVIVPACSFVASAHAVAQTGATPIFCDVDAATAQIDPAAAAAAVSPRTRAIMPVHLYGLPAPIDEINALARRHGLKVIEDAACALGASYKGTPCGALGDAASFSFHPRKVITTGEGGALTSADEVLLAQARAQRNHGAGMSGYDRFAARDGMLPSFDLLGFNYRLTDLQARVGLPQLARLAQIVDERRAHAAHYDAALADLEGLTPLAVVDGGRACYQSYILRLLDDAPTTAAEALAHLDAHGIQAVQGAQLLPELGYYRDSSGFRPGLFPAAEHLAERSFAIPLYAGLTEPERDRVVHAIRGLWS